MQRKQINVIPLVSLLTLSFVLSGFALFGADMRLYSTRVEDTLAQVVGMSAGVEPNQYNTLAQALTQKQSELEGREPALNKRELELQAAMQTEISRSYRQVLMTVAISVFVLLFLIGMNFYLDLKRSKGKESRRFGELQTKL